VRAALGELLSEVREADSSFSVPLGTARWMGLPEATTKFRYQEEARSDQSWIGEAFDATATPLGYADDRHVCLVSGTRGGKGAGVIIPNLCLWPGSCIVIDPKGENGTVTARRRGNGSAFAQGLGQKVCILDPFGEVSLETTLKARFNPLDVIDVDGDLAVADAGRIAAAIVVRENKTDPYWEEAARNLIKGFILHVLSEPYFEGLRNLVTVRRLLTQGDWLLADTLRRAGEEKIPSAFGLLWERMRRNSAFNGVVAGVGEQMMSMAERTRSGVLATARTNTEFLDDRPMQRLLEVSDFDLAEIKTSPGGLTIYLTLPQRYMDTHYRWLRLMISLAVGEMERIKGRPRTGYPTLFVLDEFAGLKRMETIEHAVAQAAGFGVKFFFVAQNLAQLKVVYEEGWESFVSNAGLKMFFQIDDDFTRAYVSRLIGEYEVKRETRSTSRSQSSSLSTTEGKSSSVNTGTSSGSTDGRSRGDSLTYAGWFRIFSKSDTRQAGRSWSRSETSSRGSSEGTSFSRGETHGDSTTTGWGEAVHKRALLNPDEIGRFLSRIDDHGHPAYPGIVLAILPGHDPLLARRVNYFEAPLFAGCFDPHPNYPPPMTLAERAEARRWAAAVALPPPTRRNAPWAEMWRRAQSVTGAVVRMAATAFSGLYKAVRTVIALTIAGLAIAVLIKLLAAPEGPKTVNDDRAKAEAAATATRAPVSPAAPATIAPAPPAPIDPPARSAALPQGSIFPLGAKAWVAPASNGDDPSVGLFQNGTMVDILDRVQGPYGWDWFKVRGPTNDGQVVEAFVRADLIAGTGIKPQPGFRCARDNGSEEYGRTPVYTKEVMRMMTGLRDTYPDLVMARLPPKSFYTVGPSMRAANGWEWHTVQFADGRQGVVRADQLRPGPASQENGNWICQSN